jgi:phytanoyl-CoA hydroxylase
MPTTTATEKPTATATVPAGPLTEEQIRSFRENGFLYYGPVLTPEELTALQEALARVEAGESEKSPEAKRNLLGEKSELVVTQIVNIWEAEPAFFRHLFNDRIVPMAAQLMGTDTVRVWHDQVQVKPPKIGGPTIWHQDHPYWPVIQPADLVSAWVAIEDATIENGCMSMVRHSHKWGPYKGGTVGSNPDDWGPAADPSFLPEGETMDVVPIEVPAGAVVFHHCLTWHGAPPNRSEKNRPAIAVHYMPGWTRYEKEPGKAHLVEHHITVQPGEALKGEHFPTVMENGKVLSPETAN